MKFFYLYFVLYTFDCWHIKIQSRFFFIHVSMIIIRDYFLEAKTDATCEQQNLNISIKPRYNFKSQMKKTINKLHKADRWAAKTKRMPQSSTWPIGKSCRFRNWLRKRKRWKLLQWCNTRSRARIRFSEPLATSFVSWNYYLMLE